MKLSRVDMCVMWYSSFVVFVIANEVELCLMLGLSLKFRFDTAWRPQCEYLWTRSCCTPWTWSHLTFPRQTSRMMTGFVCLLTPDLWAHPVSRCCCSDGSFSFSDFHNFFAPLAAGCRKINVSKSININYSLMPSFQINCKFVMDIFDIFIRQHQPPHFPLLHEKQ